MICNFLMPSKLFHGEAESYCFTVSCVPDSMSLYLISDFLCSDMIRIKYKAYLLYVNKNKGMAD